MFYCTAQQSMDCCAFYRVNCVVLVLRHATWARLLLYSVETTQSQLVCMDWFIYRSAMLVFSPRSLVVNIGDLDWYSLESQADGPKPDAATVFVTWNRYSVLLWATNYDAQFDHSDTWFVYVGENWEVSASNLLQWWVIHFDHLHVAHYAKITPLPLYVFYQRSIKIGIRWQAMQTWLEHKLITFQGFNLCYTMSVHAYGT